MLLKRGWFNRGISQIQIIIWIVVALVTAAVVVLIIRGILKSLVG